MAVNNVSFVGWNAAVFGKEGSFNGECSGLRLSGVECRFSNRQEIIKKKVTEICQSMEYKYYRGLNGGSPRLI